MTHNEWMAWGRRLIEEIASGRVTPDTNEEYFLEDTVHLSVWTVEAEDPDWLLSAVGDRSNPLAGRLLVVQNMIKMRERALELLRREAPDLDDPWQPTDEPLIDRGSSWWKALWSSGHRPARCF
jgi:hypothetical protein